MSGRIAKLREACARKGIDAFCVRDTSNIRWLTGFDGVFDEERAHALLVGPRGAVLHTDSRYAEAARAAAANGGEVAVDDARARHAAFAVSRIGDVVTREEFAAAGTGGGAAADGDARDASLGAADVDAPDAADACGGDAAAGGLTLGIEDSITLAEYRQMEAECEKAATAGAPAPCLRETTDVVLRLRAVKDAGEIERLCAAQAVTDAAFRHIVEFMRPGMTERMVQVELEDFMRRHGADDLAFSSIVATGANGASPHAIPGDTVLEAGQCVVLDFGAKVRGYCSDMTRTVFLGQPDARLRAAYETLCRANEEVERALRPGVTGRQMHELAESVLEAGGFGGRMGHGLGHGVGLDIHELPNLSPRNAEPLVAGNVVTVEPGIYVPGEFGMRLEDFGVVTSEGFRVFTQSPHDMVII